MNKHNKSLVLGGACAIAAVLSIGSASLAAPGESERTGVFFDFPVSGLEYKALPSGVSGRTDADGSFRYHDGDQVTFSIGSVTLGTTKGKEWVTPSDIVPEAKGDVHNPRLNNIGILIESLDSNGNNEDGIVITPAAHAAVQQNASSLNFDLSTDAFSKIVKNSIFPEIEKNNGFTPAEGGAIKGNDDSGKHFVRPAAAVRNQLRRAQLGFVRLTDVKIPLTGYDAVTNPDAYVLGTLYRPVGPGYPEKVPVVMNMGPYGKDRTTASICSRNEFYNEEVLQDRLHSGNPDNLPYENHETVDTFTWVPKGYAVLKVDEAGSGRTPGKYWPFGRTMQKNYVDAIDWAGTQPWSNGKVGTIGISYYAVSQWLMSRYLPEDTHLTAMIPWEGASDGYRDLFYQGGLPIEQFIKAGFSLKGKVGRNSCTHQATDDPTTGWFDEHVFNDPEFWDEYTADVSNLNIPFMSAAGVDNFSIHPRGNVMAFREAPSKNKLLRVQTGGHIEPFYAPDGVADQMAFFDYWLKGVDTGIMDKPPVKIAMKTGNGGYYWAYTTDWPVPKTQYRKFYLDARENMSGFKVDGTMPTLQLHPSKDVVTAKANPSKSAPEQKASATYNAAVKPALQQLGPPWFKLFQPCDSYGVSFASPPMTETVTLAGHAKLVTWVSSSTTDMDVHASLRVYDENGKQVVFPTDEHRIDASQKAPIQVARLKVSQRKLDTKKSTFFQPVQTHLESDSQKLTPGEIVQIEVEFWPLTAEIKKGWRVVVDIQPYQPCGGGWHRRYGDYNTGTNTIYTGPGHESYVQLPVVSGLTREIPKVAWVAPKK